MCGENTLKLLAGNGFLKVKVKANAKETRIRSIDNDIVLMDVKAPPIEGKANREIIKFLSKALKKKVILKSGAGSKIKLFSIV